MPWKDILRAVMATAAVRQIVGNIPSGPVGRSKNTAWRDSSRQASRAARANRNKARRKARGAGKEE